MKDDEAKGAHRRLYGEYGNAVDGPRDDPPYDHAAVTKESLLRTLDIEHEARVEGLRTHIRLLEAALSDEVHCSCAKEAQLAHVQGEKRVLEEKLAESKRAHEALEQAALVRRVFDKDKVAVPYHWLREAVRVIQAFADSKTPCAREGWGTTKYELERLLSLAETEAAAPEKKETTP